MQTISEDYRSINKELHESNPNYGTIGQVYADQVMTLVELTGSRDILDYGCGKSTLAMNLPFDIREYDPAIKGKEGKPTPADIVICTDVLEHVEPEYIDAVLDHLKSLTRRTGLFSVATRPAMKTLSDGRNAHLIVKPLSWWIDKLESRFNLAMIQNVENKVFGIVVEPKYDH